MATIINNPTQSDNSDGGIGVVIGFLLLVVAAILFWVYGLPALQQRQSGEPIEVDVNVEQEPAPEPEPEPDPAP